MAGNFLEYFDGYLRVEFRNGRWLGDIAITFLVSGDTTVTTPCDDDFEKGDAQIDVAGDVRLHCWTSSTMSWFFRGMVNWLEAVTCNVAECAFSWDGEGPEGELRWFDGMRDSGLLNLAWTGRRDSAAFEHQVRLNKQQMVRALYRSFREFVESDRYDPINYERLVLGEIFDLVLNEGRDACVHEIAVRDRLEAYALIQTIVGFAHDREKKAPRQTSLLELMQQAQVYWKVLPVDEESLEERISGLFDVTWNEWTYDRRRRYAEEELCSVGGYGEFGESLRTLRSPLIESWLATRAQENASAQTSVG